jgi:hypothetical protein
MRLPPLLTLLLCALGFLCPQAHGRNFRVARIPNGSVISCANCHVNPAGAGTRTAFGAAVNTAIGGTSSNVAFWTADFAALDSDGDGRTNGVELRDPDGDLIPIDAVGVTNPGNRPPNFTATPVPSATMGVAYNSTTTAVDAEANAFTFAKVSGPSWLSVSSAGAVSGLPPAGSAGSFPVTIRVTDSGTLTKGYSLGSNTQTYTLNVISSYSGWQSLNFTLPTEAALASPLADPDHDGLANVLEYAVRLPSRTSSSSALFATTPDVEGRLTATLDVRDDDPKLSVIMEAADDLTFTNPTTIAPEVTDPVPGDGVQRYFFMDNVLPQSGAGRFVRIRVSLLP